MHIYSIINRSTAATHTDTGSEATTSRTFRGDTSICEPEMDRESIFSKTVLLQMLSSSRISRIPSSEYCLYKAHHISNT